MKTGGQIENDVYELLSSSKIKTLITGKLYRDISYRPIGSTAEDAVVIFTTGLSNQVQTGIVTINIYIPDIDAFQNGVLVKDKKRCDKMEEAVNNWVSTLTAGKSKYLFALQQTIYTEQEAEIHQHFVVVKLKYKLFEN